MVLLDGKKFACATCIKGHRSSSCAHTTRPLFEIKKKGRPVTQCDHCRQLRRTKQVHVKCLCESREEDDSRSRSFSSKSPKASLTSADLEWGMPQSTMHKDPGVKSCGCATTGVCNCSSPKISNDVRKSPPTIQVSEPLSIPLHPYHSVQPSIPTTQPLPLPSYALAGNNLLSTRYHPYSMTIGMPNPRLAQSSPELTQPLVELINSWPKTPVSTIPSFSPWLGSCSCGASCDCPGCLDHRGTASMMSSESCPNSCSSCSDCLGGLSKTFGFPLSGQAVTLPAPPRTGVGDTNVAAYSPRLWPDNGAVKMSTLERCRGNCKCIPNECSCIQECCGCCLGCVCEEHCDIPGSKQTSFAISGERATCCSEKAPIQERSMASTLTPPIVTGGYSDTSSFMPLSDPSLIISPNSLPAFSPPPPRSCCNSDP